jgi:bifunctional non-homologous end joining protein LigD
MQARASYPLTHPDKVLYPEQGITKLTLLEYYARVAIRMLPHVANRPLSLVRCPDGQAKPCFFQKHLGQGLPPGVSTVRIAEKRGEGDYAVIRDEQGLFGLVQMGVLEIHTWGAQAEDPEHPDVLVFDLDPDTSVEYERVIAAALRIREMLAIGKLMSFVKTTGGKGLHVCVPIEPDASWEEVKKFCAGIGNALVREAPHSYVTSAVKARRTGKIFVDYLRNTRGATFIAPYSTRARQGAPVAMPLYWEELSLAPKPDHFSVGNIERRLEALKGDPFAEFLDSRRSLHSFE